MGDKNKTKLILGLILVVISFACAVLALYFMGQQQSLERNQMVSLEVELANLIGEKSEAVIQESDPHWVKREPIELEAYLSRSEEIYGESELLRDEGVLWIDRKSSRLIVTLGSVNGLQKGSILRIYEGETIIGRVVVEIPYDIISSVRFVDKTMDDFRKSYYKIDIEG